MENIDPIYFLTPIVIIAFSFGLALYWQRRRRLTVLVLLFSLVAYFGAIFAKYVVQAITYAPFDTAVNASPWALGLYFGMQTVIFEVGGAYVIARYAVSRGMMKAKDAEGYGISLATWENGVLIGGALLLDYATYYATLSSGSGASAEQLFGALAQSSPSLFYPPASALPLIGYAILERISSLLVHFSWGYLCVLAAVFKKRSFLIIALPMGMIDFLVPFTGALGLATSEGILFALGLASLGVALISTRGELTRRAMLVSNPKSVTTPSSAVVAPVADPGSAELRSLISANFRRALKFGRIYLVIGMVLPLVFIAEISAAGNTAGAPTVDDIYPLILPMFVVLGSVGGLMTFSSDKDKGVYEYLIAYGVDPSTIFWSVIVATMGIVTVVLVVSLSVTVAALAIIGNVLSVGFGELILFYSLPLSYAATMFMSMAGMIWSQLTTRVSGVNSPVGVAPILGIGPILAVLLTVTVLVPNYVLYVAAGASVAMVWAVVVLVTVVASKMQRERFLSNA